MDLKLQGKRARVTGASGGLGYAIALGLAREGSRVAINSRNAEKLQAAAQAIAAQTGAAAYAIPGSVTDIPEQIVAEASTALGGLDLLVTNAGGPPAGSFESFDDAAWMKAIDLSLMSHVGLIRAAVGIRLELIFTKIWQFRIKME